MQFPRLNKLPFTAAIHLQHSRFGSRWLYLLNSNVHVTCRQFPHSFSPTFSIILYYTICLMIDFDIDEIFVRCVYGCAPLSITSQVDCCLFVRNSSAVVKMLPKNQLNNAYKYSGESVHFHLVYHGSWHDQYLVYKINGILVFFRFRVEIMIFVCHGLPGLELSTNDVFLLRYCRIHFILVDRST